MTNEQELIALRRRLSELWAMAQYSGTWHGASTTIKSIPISLYSEINELSSRVRKLEAL